MSLRNFFNEKRVNILLLSCFVFTAFYFAFKASNGLLLPVDDDSYRDLATIENILHDNFLNDPSYLHQYLWYNPLFPLVQVSIIKFTGVQPAIFLAQAGKYLNLLSPVFFYFMCLRLFDRNVALAACTAFLFFICGNDYGSHVAGYTYILLPNVFTQFLFYIELIFFYKMFSGKTKWFWFSGLLCGIIFLFHTAPAILLTLIASCFFLRDFFKNKTQRKKLFIQYNYFILSFLIVISPFIYFIFIHFHFQMKNTLPSQWIYYLLRPENFMLLLKENFTVWFAIAIAGFIILIKDKKLTTLSRRIILFWLFCSIILLIYSNTASIINTKYKIHLPSIIPSFHFYFYLKAVQAVLFGVGFIAICKWMKEKFFLSRISFNILFYLLLLLFVILRLPGYSKRKEFTLLQQKTLVKQSDTASINMYNWIKNNTKINDVILCYGNESEFPVMATGRKMIVTTDYYSNPYVNYIQRKKDNDLLLNSNNKIITEELLKKYEVKYLLVNTSSAVQYSYLESYFPFEVYKNNEMILFKK